MNNSFVHEWSWVDAVGLDERGGMHDGNSVEKKVLVRKKSLWGLS